MPIHPEMRDLNPLEWPQISRCIRSERANNRFEWCEAENTSRTRKPAAALFSRSGIWTKARATTRRTIWPRYPSPATTPTTQ